MERDQKLKYNEDGDYSKEYYTLIKARKDIKDKIKEIIDAALVFSEIVMMGEFSARSSRAVPGRPITRIFNDPDLIDYELTGDEGDVREAISNEAIEFVKDVFNEERITRLLDAIFFHGYRPLKPILGMDGEPTGESIPQRPPIIGKEHGEYLIRIAKVMATTSINELENHLDSSYAKFLSEDLKRAVEICNVMGGQTKSTRVFPEILPEKLGYSI